MDLAAFFSHLKSVFSHPTPIALTLTHAHTGLATYNIMHNTKYKELFNISWDFAFKHSHLLSVRLDKPMGHLDERDVDAKAIERKRRNTVFAHGGSESSKIIESTRVSHATRGSTDSESYSYKYSEEEMSTRVSTRTPASPTPPERRQTKAEHHRAAPPPPPHQRPMSSNPTETHRPAF